MLNKVDWFALDPSAFIADNERVEQVHHSLGREGGQERANYGLDDLLGHHAVTYARGRLQVWRSGRPLEVFHG